MTTDTEMERMREYLAKRRAAKVNNSPRVQQVKKQVEQLARENEAEYMLCGFIFKLPEN